MGAGVSGAWVRVYYIGMSAAGRRAGWRSGRAWWVLGGLAVGVRGRGGGGGQGGNTTGVAAPKKQGVSGAKLKFSGLTDFNKCTLNKLHIGKQGRCWVLLRCNRNGRDGTEV